MKLVVLLSRFPYPLEKGDKLRAFHQLKALAKQHEVVLCALTDVPIQPEWQEKVSDFCHEVHVFPLKKPLIYWNTIKQFFTGSPYQTGYFYQRGIHKKIDRIIARYPPDHIYCQLIRTTEYVKNIHHIPKTLDYMDALGKGMHRRAAISTGIKKRIFSIEGKRLTEYENRIFDYFNHHTIISEQDREFIGHPQNKNIHIIENGIDPGFSTYPLKDKPEYDLVFTGNMNYPPNVECAVFIVNAILPLVQKKHPEIKVLLSGAKPHARVVALGENSAVTVTGWVKDIRDSYANGKIFIAPLFIGTGLQNKLLEAMAMGLPCITTSLANNALKAKDNESVLIANDAEAFAQKIDHLLHHEQEKHSISSAARKFVANHFDWENSVRKLEQVMEG